MHFLPSEKRNEAKLGLKEDKIFFEINLTMRNSSCQVAHKETVKFTSIVIKNTPLLGVPRFKPICMIFTL